MWLWNNHPKLRGLSWHVENERKRNKVQQGIAKAKGIIPGVPDYVFNYAKSVYYFEFKTEIGIQSGAQKEVQRQLQDQGLNYYIVRSKEEFIRIIEGIINHNKNKKPTI